MKHYKTMFAALVVACGLAAAVIAAQPSTVTIALAGGATNVGTNAYTTGISRAAHASFQPLAVEYTIAGSISVAPTITVHRAVSGPTYATITGTVSNETGVGFITSSWYFERGDSMYVTLNVTNAASIKIQGAEQ